MVKLLFLKSLLLLVYFLHSGESWGESRFSCQGPTYESARKACPDKGLQWNSAGGNVSVLVHRAINIPNFDNGATAGNSNLYYTI